MRWMLLSAGVSQSSRRDGPFDTRWLDLIAVTSSVERELRARTLELKLFPNENIDLNSKNTWTTVLANSADTLSFLTDNLLQVKLGPSLFWETSWRYSIIPDANDKRQDGESRFDKTWVSWLYTRQGVGASYAENDSTRLLSIGPCLGVNINAADMFIFRKILNSHTLSVTWTRQKSGVIAAPDVMYTLFLSMQIKPNIVFENRTVIAGRQGSLTKLSGSLALVSNF